jgi:hypothetical protein
MKKKKKRKRGHFNWLPFNESPTAIDIWRENKEHKKVNDDYWGCF